MTVEMTRKMEDEGAVYCFGRKQQGLDAPGPNPRLLPEGRPLGFLRREVGWHSHEPSESKKFTALDVSSRVNSPEPNPRLLPEGRPLGFRLRDLGWTRGISSIKNCLLTF